MPDAPASAAATELERYGAVAMFCDRARARDPAFTLDESTGPPVSEICRRLEGLPLALGSPLRARGCSRCPSLPRGWMARSRCWSAARATRPTPADAARDHRLELHAAHDEERSAFAHMAVFAGGATVATAEAVTGASLDTLDSLVAKQLLARRASACSCSKPCASTRSNG